jgi:tetratricopeptide (TPR) repeat protein
MTLDAIEATAAAAAREAGVALQLDGMQVAVRALEEQAQLCPRYADIRFRLGLLHLARGEYAKATTEFEDALGIHPGYRAALRALRLTGLLQGDLPAGDAPAIAEDVVPRDEALWERTERAYQALARGEDAIEALFDPAGQEPVFYHHYAAVFATRRGDPAAARRHWNAAAELSETARACLERLHVLPWGASSEAASARVAEWLWSPLAVGLYEFLGRIYARNGLIGEARDCFAQAYFVLPRDASHALHLATLANAAGEEERTLELLTRAVATDPALVEARIALGLESAAQDRTEEARVHLEAAAALAPGFADVRYNLGLLYDGEGRVEEAAGQYRRALQINPGYLPARQSLAALLCRTGRAEDGLVEYERVLRQGFQSADMLVKMGRAALELGRVEEALQYLERASFVNPDYALSYYYLGQAYRSKGLRNKARAAWRRHLERASDWERSSRGLPEPPPAT